MEKQIEFLYWYCSKLDSFFHVLLSWDSLLQLDSLSESSSSECLLEASDDFLYNIFVNLAICLF